MHMNWLYCFKNVVHPIKDKYIYSTYASFKNILIYERIHGSLVITAGIYH